MDRMSFYDAYRLHSTLKARMRSLMSFHFLYCALLNKIYAMLNSIPSSVAPSYFAVQKSPALSLLSIPIEIRDEVKNYLDWSDQQNLFKALATVTQNGKPVDNSPALKMHLLLQRVPSKFQETLARSDASLQAFALNQLEMLWESKQLLRKITEKPALIKLLFFACGPAIFEFLKGKIEPELELKQELLSWVERSKSEEVQAIAANALTLLVKAGVDLSEQNFNGIRVFEADLSYGKFDQTQFEGADLNNVNFHGAWLQGANLQKANLKGVNFGELPSLEVEGWANQCCYSPDGQWLAVGMGDVPGDYNYNQIKLYRTETLEPIFTLRGYPDQVLSLSFSPDGKILASSSLNQTVIKLWEIERGRARVLCTLGEGSQGWGVNSVHFSPNGKVLAAGNADGTIELWRVEDGERLNIFKGHHRRIQSINFSPDGKLLASGSADETVKLWHVESAEVFHTLEGHKDSYVRSVHFSPDGKLLASGGNDMTVKLWNVESGEVLHTLEGHSDSVTSVRFSPDGKFLASASLDDMVKLWKVGSGKELHTFKGHCYAVNSVNFSPDGRFLVSGDGAKEVRVWNIDKWNTGLHLSSPQKELTVVNMSIQDAQNVSPLNGHLLKQKGAFGEPDRILDKWRIYG